MQQAQAEKKAVELRGLLEKYGHHYYVLDDPIVPDSEYDEKLKELVDIEEAFPELQTEDSQQSAGFRWIHLRRSSMRYR